MFARLIKTQMPGDFFSSDTEYAMFITIRHVACTPRCLSGTILQIGPGLKTEML